MSFDSNIEVYLRDTHEKAYIEWKLQNIETAKTITSPRFSFLNITWFFEIQTPSKKNEWVNLIVNAESSILQHDLNFEVHVRDYRRIFKFKKFTETCELKMRSICQYNELTTAKPFAITIFNFNSAKNFAPVDAACQTGLLYSAFISCGDFKDLLNDENNSDVRIAVSGVEFKAHKLILQTRSPVFAAMFEHDMAEKKESIVKIDDCDPDVFQQFLNSIYTGKVENLFPENVTRLYAVADKYGTKELKEKCAIFMVEYLSEDTACDVLVTADRHNDSDLKRSAEQFLVQNIEKIIDTDKWKSLMVDNVVLASQILLNVVQNGISSKAKVVS